MPILGIRRRYIGTETHPTMLAYNQALKDVLGDGLLEIKRLQKDGKDISASMVRAFISKQEVESALEFVPKAARARLREICLQKFKTK
jgi:citrate lyase synthetase